MEQRGELYTLTINAASLAEAGLVEFELPLPEGLFITYYRQLFSKNIMNLKSWI